jgi:G3E family GTPase
MTEIYIVSGFLGAGKTTLIRKLLKEAFYQEKVVLLENDFGEVSVDAALLKSGGIEVKEINSGCICCSLSGDFVKAVREIHRQYRPDKIIIEPSGVGKLSDVARACEDPAIQPPVNIKRKITVADAARCQSYLDNFGEFYEDQIENADVIVLSHTAEHPDKANAAVDSIKALNPHVPVFSKPWNQIGADEILFPRRGQHGQEECSPNYGYSHDSSHDHEYEYDHDHGHDHECDHDHDHSAEEVFDTVTIRTTRKFRNDELKNFIYRLERDFPGTVLRAKGILRGINGYIELQYLPGDLKIEDCDTEGDMLNIIGKDLNKQELIGLLEGA